MEMMYTCTCQKRIQTFICVQVVAVYLKVAGAAVGEWIPAAPRGTSLNICIVFDTAELLDLPLHIFPLSFQFSERYT